MLGNLNTKKQSHPLQIGTLNVGSHVSIKGCIHIIF